MGRANYDLPDDLLLKVKKLANVSSKREAIVIALDEYLKKKKIEKLIQARGKMPLNWAKKSLKKYRG